MKIYTNVDLRYNTIENASIQRSQPSTPKEGTIYYNAGQNAIMYYDGSDWIKIGGGSETPPSTTNLEQVNISANSNAGTNLIIDSNKAVKLNFYSAGDGVLKLRDGNNNNQVLGTLNIANPGITITDVVGSIGAYGILPSGYTTYIFEHKLETDNLIVQVIDDKGSTVVCDVTRYTDPNTDKHYIKIEFAKTTLISFKVVITGHPKYPLMYLADRINSYNNGI